jgi:hypothetical protein
VGKSLCERDLLPTAREIMAKAKAEGRELVLPVDAVVAKTFAANAPSRVIAVVEVAEAAAELTAAGKIITVAGGGDTVAALNAAGATERFRRRARKPATVRRRLSSNIKKDYPILQIAVYGGIEGVNKIIEPLHEPFTRVRCYARQMSGANQLALRPR